MNHQKFLAGLLACAMALALTACGGEEQVEDTVPAGVAVQVKTVSAGSIATENRVSGRVTAENTSTIMVATAAEIVEEMLAERS